MNVRTLSRQLFTLAMVALLAGGAFLTSALVTARPAQAAGCAAGEVGSVTTSTFNVPTANVDSYRLWVQLKGTSAGVVSVELDGNNCLSQQISGLNTSNWLWSPIGAAQPIAAGNHTLTIKVYTGGISMLGGMLLNDGCNPNTEATLCASQSATPTPLITATPKPSTVVLTPTPTPKPVATPTPTPVPTPAPTPTPSTGSPLTKGASNDSKLTYSGVWNVGGNDGLYNKYQADDHWSNVVGASYTFKYTGSDVAIYGAKAPHHGKAEVAIDSRPAVTIDLYAATRADNVLLYELKGLPSATHTVTVKVVSGTVTVDRIEVDQSATSTPTPTTTPAPSADTLAPNGPATTQPALVFDWLSGRYRLDISWPVATDNSGAVASYEVQRNGQKIGTSSGTIYGDYGVQTGIGYTYQVFSIDGAGNRSSGSTPRTTTISCFWIFCGI